MFLLTSNSVKLFPSQYKVSNAVFLLTSNSVKLFPLQFKYSNTVFLLTSSTFKLLYEQSKVSNAVKYSIPVRFFILTSPSSPSFSQSIALTSLISSALKLLSSFKSYCLTNSRKFLSGKFFSLISTDATALVFLPICMPTSAKTVFGNIISTMQDISSILNNFFLIFIFRLSAQGTNVS